MTAMGNPVKMGVKDSGVKGIPILRALGQTSKTVVLREPGDRFLSRPLPIAPHAREHWEFGWLSVAAYNETPAARNDALKRQKKTVPAESAAASGLASGSLNPAAKALAAAGWVRWLDFPGDGLLEEISQTHLRVEVWERRDPPAVAVTFGGTVFKNGKDWLANLRWFIPKHHDEYTEVVQTFAPAFAVQLRRRMEDRTRPDLKDMKLFATGHSLGGGLAQQFAYSVPLDSVGRVHKVYAFDPSPVTGFLSVAKRLRDHNKKGLLIDRVYERGEILALLRSITSVFWKPTARNATIRGVRYALFHAWNGVAAHSIGDLAQKLDEAR